MGCDSSVLAPMELLSRYGLGLTPSHLDSGELLGLPPGIWQEYLQWARKKRVGSDKHLTLDYDKEVGSRFLS